MAQWGMDHLLHGRHQRRSLDRQLVDLRPPPGRGGLFASYQPPSRSFDELYEPSGDLRPGWSTLGAHFEKLGIEGIEAGSKLVRRLVRQSSISDQNTMGPSRTITWFDTTHRPWQLDAIPWVLSACEWESLSDGLRQRARLLNRILVDLHGPQNLISEGKIPAEVVYSHPGFSRPFHGWSVPQSLYLHCYTADLVRTEDGAWKVVADRTDSPLGVGYALENRLVLSRTYPSIFRDTLVQRLAPFFIQLRTLLSQLSPKNQDNPRVVLLTHGPGTAGYFEDVYLARYLGYNLVESGDLTVREDRLYLKTLGGLLQVDVLFRRLSDQLCDPLEFQADASLGVPGLTRAARAGQVLVVNALGSSLVESPVFMPFLEELSTHLLGERLKIASVPTWWCGDPEQCRFVLRQPNDYMFVSGYRVGRQTIFPNLSRAQIHESERLEILRRRPSMYVAQSKFERSMVPCYRDGKIQPLYAALRVYLVADGEDYLVLPGGLGRVASENEMLEKNILQGQNSKEVWVLSEGPVPPISLLSGSTGPKKEFSRDGSELTSRVADNLLWLGRYVERADGNARLLRTTLLRLARESNVESLPEWSGLVRQLADRGLIEPGYAVKGLRERLPSLSERLPTIAIDDHQSGNLRDNLRQIVRLSSILRDRLSPDSWQTSISSKVGCSPNHRWDRANPTMPLEF